MKIRNPWIIKWIGFLGAWLIRVYMGTICVRLRGVGLVVDPSVKKPAARYIFAFFHENILLPCAAFGGRHVYVLISQHADGEMIARACRHLGYNTVRGSSTRGGSAALKAMIDASRTGHIVVVPDGPRGPRRHVERGLVYLAAQTGLPIIPLGVGYRNAWRLPTWDKFAIPRPFSEGLAIEGEPIRIPADLNRTQIEEYRRLVEAALLAINDRAERLASR